MVLSHHVTLGYTLIFGFCRCDFVKPNEKESLSAMMYFLHAFVNPRFGKRKKTAQEWVVIVSDSTAGGERINLVAKIGKDCFVFPTFSKKIQKRWELLAAIVLLF